uniref:Sulfhydryl oxidase n=1 Tax=Onchocerca volvulus TaxID=6282 RepID=A0A8R1TUD8_ONCVO
MEDDLVVIKGMDEQYQDEVALFSGSMFSLIILLALFACEKTIGYVSNMNYIPMGNNPTLYQPGYDPIMQLDAATFHDTIFMQDHAFVVEFYADWCGHCRAFTPFYLEFATSIRSWENVVTVAAINCADVVNRKICSDEQIIGYPMILYYPRYARSRADAIKLEPKHSLSHMRNQLTQVLRNEYNQFRYADWPDFTFLTADSAMAMRNFWNKMNDSHEFLVFLFEQFDSVGAEFLLDMFPLRKTVLTRRIIVPSPIIRSFTITHLPYILIFKRNQDNPIYQSPYGPHSLQEVMSITYAYVAHTQPVFHVPPVPLPVKEHVVVQCELHHDRCRELYYVSETDMLKAMRMAIFDEVIKTDSNIADTNLTALLNFISVLAEHFPIYTSNTTSRTTNHKSFAALKQSTRAKSVFLHLRHFLEANKGKRTISTSVWRNQFQNIERVYGYPFPTNASWEHCKGTTPGYRGYTCGLWTTFHAMTVNAFTQELQTPINLLLGIRGWVANFFGCLDCRRHFLHMTSTLYPLTKSRVKNAQDMMFYLWRAHNIVNARLHGDKATEDPQFEKRQFPPFFLCSTCHSDGMFSRKNVRDFLINFYTAIRPYNEMQRISNSRQLSQPF